jgi:hypothetical protein
MGAIALVLAIPAAVGFRAARAQAAREPERDPDAPSPDGGAPVTTTIDPAAFEARLAQAEELVRNNQPTVQLGGYVDLGGFIPQGNGAGYIEDFGHLVFPEYGGRYGWVFLGDILAPAVNTRGEVADLGDAPGVDRYDAINSRGAPGLVANEVNLTLRSALTPTTLLSASANFTPRTGSEFHLGDSFDVDIAQVEWLPTDSQRTSVFVGKVDSVIGVEYRERKSDRRFGITPTLMARYTIGTALGVKVRTKLGRNDWVVVAVAITNGSFTTEQFHFYDEIDSNRGKTASGRVAARLPAGIEIGLSGSWGPQDRATDVAHAMWFFGPDLLARFGPTEVKGQWLKGAAAGDASENVYGLRLSGGGYLEADTMVTPSFGFLLRAEYRDALVWQGSERAYATKTWRAVAGLRYVLAARAVLKLEFLHNAEYGRIPNIPNDVVTSSLVMGF